MGSSINNRITRTILGALIQSNLSAQELKRYSSDRDLQEMTLERLRFILQFFEDQSVADNKERLTDSFNAIEMAYEAIQRRRISKNEVVELLRSSGGYRTGYNPTAMTVKEMLLTYFENSSPSDQKRLLDRLVLPTSRDAYLEGILRKGAK